MFLIAQTISKDDLDHMVFGKTKKLKSLLLAIEEYNQGAFNPEIITALSLVENSKIAAELFSKYLNMSGEEGITRTFTEQRFQMQLSYIQQKFEESLSSIKLLQNRILFIDGIDIRPGIIPYDDYLDCVKGLANAVWAINNDFFSNIKDSKGRLRVVLLMRPDIFNSLSFQNMTNKIHDNSVLLDWRTTYPVYRKSELFQLADKLLSSQQNISMENGYFDKYFPWKLPALTVSRDKDDAFIGLLRHSYSRPRDIITIFQLLKEQMIEKGHGHFTEFDMAEFSSNEFLNKYSDFLMGGIKDQLAFYYSDEDYNTFIHFFNYLSSYHEFTYEEFMAAYTKYNNAVLKKLTQVPEFIGNEEVFLQVLYELNIISYYEETETEKLFHWCYRERSISNMFPKVRLNKKYKFHYGLYKALNVGAQRSK